MQLRSSAWGPVAALLIFGCASGLTFFLRSRQPLPRLVRAAPRHCPVPVERPDFGLRCLEHHEARQLGLEAGDQWRAAEGVTSPTASRARMAPGRLLTVGVQLDVNRATAEELMALPDIGPSLAARIVATRRAAPFRTRDDLLRVPGIGAERLRGLLPFLLELPN